MKLTKKYRLVWDEDLKLKLDPYYDFTGTETTVGNGLNYFESDSQTEIEQKITDENLKYENI